MHARSICTRFGMIIAVVLMTAGFAAAQADHTPEETADNDLLLYDYNNPQPERLLGFLETYQKRANSWNAFPPAVGFYAIVFRELPDWIERLVPSRFDARSAAAIDAALRLSGQSAVRQSLQPRFPESGLDAKLQDELADLPSQITDIRIAKPTHLDILWGAFFASGDERYV